MNDLESLPDISNNPSILDDLPDVNPTNKPSTIEAGVISFNNGVEKFTNWLTVPVGEKLFGKNTVSAYKSKKAEELKSAHDAHPIATTIGDVAAFTVAGLVTSAAMPISAAVGATSAIGRAGAMALEGAAQGGALGLIREPDSGSRLNQAKDYAMVGGAVGGAVKGASEVFGAAKNAIGSAVVPYVDDLKRLADKYHIPYSLENLIKDRSLTKFARKILDHVPFSSTAKLHQEQNQSYFSAIKQFVADLADTSGLSANSFRNQFNKAKGVAKTNVSDLYDNVGDLAKKSQETNKISVSNTNETIDTIISELKQNREINGPLINRLEKFKTKAGTVSFDEIRDLRTEIGRLTRQEGKATGSIQAHDSFSRLYKSITGDLDEWGNNPGNGNVYEAYQKASGAYKEYNVVFKTKEIEKALEDDTSMYKFINKLVYDKNPEHLKTATKLLPIETRHNLQAAQVQKALNDSVKLSGDEPVVDVNRFVNILTDAKKSQPELWGKEIEKLNGFTNMMSHMNSGSGVDSGASTISNFLAPAAVAGTSILNPASGGMLAGTVVSLSAMSKVLTSKQLENMMIRWSKLTPSAPKETINGMLKATTNAIINRSGQTTSNEY